MAPNVISTVNRLWNFPIPELSLENFKTRVKDKGSLEVLKLEKNIILNIRQTISTMSWRGNH